MARVIRLVLAGLAAVASTGALAGEIDRASLRGSEAYGPAPASYLVRPNMYSAGGEPTVYPTYGVPPPAPEFVAGPAPIAHAFEFEVGARYWYSSGKLAKELFDVPGGGQSLLSRLTYSGLTSQSGEAFARVDSISGVFVKGYAGLANLGKGSLNDEDFPPGISPYSSTLSDQQNGRLNYLTADLGYGLTSGPGYRVGAFVGYYHLGEKVNAFGCTQVATQPFVCVPTIPTSVLGITEDAQWDAARLGLSGDVRITERLKLAFDAAWIAYAKITAADTHWLRLGTSFSGPIPESGTGAGAQLEAALSYQFTHAFSFGVGARYWHLESRGNADFGAVIPGALPQPVNFVTERFGAFLQGAYRFGVM